MSIHPTAIIEPSATLAEDVFVGAFSYIGDNVEIGEGTRIESHVCVKGHTKIGKKNHIFQFASVGEDCQDKKYAGEETYLEIGDNNVIRESCTIHRGTIQDKSVTRIGSNNLLMAYVHVAHDCVIGDNNILANNATLAGHVHVKGNVILGGMTAVHQFCHIGEHVFSGGGSVILKDVPPFVMLGGKDNTPHGINSEGLKRRGFTSEKILLVKRAYRTIYRKGLRAQEAVEALKDLAEGDSDLLNMAEFIASSSRGIVR